MPSVQRNDRGLTFHIDVDPPLKEFNFRMSRFGDGITDWGGYFSMLGQWFQAEMVKQFATTGSYTGAQWKPLTEPYRKWKAAHYPGRPIGVRTGSLLSSMTGGGGYSEKIGRTEASFGMSESSPAADYGSHFSALRPVLRFTARQEREAQNLAHRWLVYEERMAMGSGGSGLADAVRAGEV